MTSEELSRLEELAKKADEVWFEKECFEHGEPYSKHVDTIQIAKFTALLSLAKWAMQAREALDAVSRVSIPHYADCPAELYDDELDECTCGAENASVLSSEALAAFPRGDKS